MGAVLEPRRPMKPWYSVEVRSESAYVSADVYCHAHRRQKFGEGDMTDGERAAAWRPEGERTAIAPGPSEALVAALRQITGHGAYKTWWKAGGWNTPDAGAELRDGRVHVTAPNSQWYGETETAAEMGMIEFAYEDIGPILDDLKRLAA